MLGTCGLSGPCFHELAYVYLAVCHSPNPFCLTHVSYLKRSILILSSVYPTLSAVLPRRRVYRPIDTNLQGVSSLGHSLSFLYYELFIPSTDSLSQCHQTLTLKSSTGRFSVQYINCNQAILFNLTLNQNITFTLLFNVKNISCVYNFLRVSRATKRF